MTVKEIKARRFALFKLNKCKISSMTWHAHFASIEPITMIILLDVAIGLVRS